VVDESVVTAVRRYIRALMDHDLVVRFGVVFGSYARGKADEWSDIDVLTTATVGHVAAVQAGRF